MLIKHTEDNLAQGVILHGPKILEHCLADSDTILKYTERLNFEYLNYPMPKESTDSSIWMIPKEYQIFDIEEFLINQCPEENCDRLTLELKLYRNHNMIPILRTVKYIVDTLRANNIVWGVGRGSSVASYALYLIGVHRIDSVKYKLPIEEFFKGEENG